MAFKAPHSSPILLSCLHCPLYFSTNPIILPFPQINVCFHLPPYVHAVPSARNGPFSLSESYSSRKTQSVQMHLLNKVVTSSTNCTLFNSSLLRYSDLTLSLQQYYFMLFFLSGSWLYIYLKLP